MLLEISSCEVIKKENNLNNITIKQYTGKMGL